LRTAALLQATAIKLLWDTCHPDAARKVAFAFIDWLNKHTPAGKETQVQNLILAILRGIGEVTGAPADGDFGVGFFNPANTNNTVITTVNHHALLELEPGSFLVPTEIVISRKAGDPNLTNFDGNQFPPTYDYNAINSTNTHVLQPGKTANIAFCLLVIGSPTTPGNGYPANLAMGHNPVAGAPGFPFEILDPFDLEGTPLRNSLTCPGIDDVIGSAGGGLQNFANAAMQTADRFFLPQPLWAATLGTLPPPPPLTGKAGSLSPFKPVEVESSSSLVFFQSESFGNVPFDPGGQIFQAGNVMTWPYPSGLETFGYAYPAVQVLDGSLNPMSGVNVTVSLIYIDGIAGTLAGTFTQSTSGGNSAAGSNTAVFDDLRVNQTLSGDGYYRLMFTAPGAPSIQSGTFRVSNTP
jgi:hypothetical protein